MLSKEKAKEIESYYKVVLELLLLNKIKQAKIILYNTFDGDLYDESLNLLGNNNSNNIKYKSLKLLINEVHELIDEYKEETI